MRSATATKTRSTSAEPTNVLDAEGLGALAPRRLDGERAAAAAGALDVGIIELETGAFQRLDEIDFGAVEVQQAGLVHEDLQAIVVVSLVEHIRSVLEGHGIAETGAPSADDGNAQPTWFRLLAV